MIRVKRSVKQKFKDYEDMLKQKRLDSFFEEDEEEVGINEDT